MLLVADRKDQHRVPVEEPPEDDRWIDRLLAAPRSAVPAITHVDYSARIQTVDPHRHGRYYRLLKRFKEKTGCPIIVNTSFNIRGEPVVCTPQDAYRCFMATNMDVLVLDDFLLYKTEQPAAEQHQVDQYMAEFELITPIGLGFRLIGRDPLSRTLDPHATTYWRPRDPVTDHARYFIQF